MNVYVEWFIITIEIIIPFIPKINIDISTQIKAKDDLSVVFITPVFKAKFVVAFKYLMICVANMFALVVNKPLVKRKNNRLKLCYSYLGVCKNILKAFGLLVAAAKYVIGISLIGVLI